MHRPRVAPPHNDRLRPASRSGFTALELLAVVTIIGVLLAICLPAVQAVREKARGMQCRNNLKQIGIAMHGYHGDHGVFPVRLNPYIRMLPYLDLASVYQAGLSLPGDQAGVSYLIPVFVCPSDAELTSEMRGGSYFLNDGSCFPFPKSNGFRRDYGEGITLYGRTIPFTRAAEVTDGLSQTACFSEHLVTWYDPTPAQARSSPTRFFWYTSTPQPTDVDLHADDCLNHRTGDWSKGYLQVNFLQTSDYHGYNHYLTPNTCPCNNGPPRPGFDDFLMSYSIPATSQHPGGVHVLYGDGAVRFASSAIDLHVWRAVGTRNGNDAVEVGD